MPPSSLGGGCLSAYALADGPAGSFLAEIGPGHAGKKVRVILGGPVHLVE